MSNKSLFDSLIEEWRLEIDTSSESELKNLLLSKAKTIQEELNTDFPFQALNKYISLINTTVERLEADTNFIWENERNEIRETIKFLKRITPKIIEWFNAINLHNIERKNIVYSLDEALEDVLEITILERYSNGHARKERENISSHLNWILWGIEDLLKKGDEIFVDTWNNEILQKLKEHINDEKLQLKNMMKSIKHELSSLKLSIQKMEEWVNPIDKSWKQSYKELEKTLKSWNFESLQADTDLPHLNSGQFMILKVKWDNFNGIWAYRISNKKVAFLVKASNILKKLNLNDLLINRYEDIQPFEETLKPWRYYSIKKVPHSSSKYYSLFDEEVET